MNIDDLNQSFKELKHELEACNLSPKAKALLQDLVDDWHANECATYLALQAQGDE